MEALGDLKREEAATRAAEAGASLGMWRYADVLPDVDALTLGEGWTPLVRSRRWPNLLLKNEGANPTGSFEARGMALAVAMARRKGARHVVGTCSGDEGSALAAYAAAAGVIAHVFMPEDVPFGDHLQSELGGADVRLVEGTAADCAKLVEASIAAQREAQVAAEDVWVDLSRMREPFRAEGAKTLGYEVVEQLGWAYPETVIYPAGCDDGVVGMWKAFEEMERLGWVSGKRPRVIVVEGQDDGVIRGVVRESGD